MGYSRTPPPEVGELVARYHAGRWDVLRKGAKGKPRGTRLVVLQDAVFDVDAVIRGWQGAECHTHLNGRLGISTVLQRTTDGEVIEPGTGQLALGARLVHLTPTGRINAWGVEYAEKEEEPC